MSTNPTSRVATGPIPLVISNGASVSPGLRVPEGMAIVGVTWPNLRNNVRIKFLDCTSITAAGRILRMLNAGSVSSTIGVFNLTTSSQPGSVFVPDLAHCGFFRIALTASLTSSRTFHVRFKS